MNKKVNIMTRINLIPPKELADQHLFAEFREIKMIPKSLARSIRARGVMGVLAMIPNEYTLGKGHVSFFYDKGSYIRIRFHAICAELTRRGINFDQTSKIDPDGVFENLPIEFQHSYIPTFTALLLIRTRIAEKIAMKPEWYRWTPPK